MEKSGKPKILVFAGSVRTGSFNAKLATLAAGELRTAGMDATLGNLRDYPMPMYNGDLEAAEGLPDGAKRFKELVRAHDVLVIVSPEYNASFPALLKNTVDWISRPTPGEPSLAVLRGKTAALLSASSGLGAGRRVLRYLTEWLAVLGMKVLPAQVNIAKGQEAFDDAGNLVRAEDRAALEHFVDELVQALR
jgi:chromate reductase, NAD(P)H dehydrogenase (quinone)